MEKHSFEEHRQSLAGKFEKRRTLYTIYFSPTGGTKKVADIVSRALSNERESGGWEMKEIDLSPAGTDYSQYHFTREDICIVAAPSFGGRVPGLVLERLKEMEGGHAKTILAAVYGNRAFEDTLLELEDTLVLAGFDCKAAVAAVAEHSIMHQFGQGRPDAEDEKRACRFCRPDKRASAKCLPPLPALRIPFPDALLSGRQNRQALFHPLRPACLDRTGA